MAKQILTSIEVDGDVTADDVIVEVDGDVVIEGPSAAYNLSVRDQEILMWMGL